MDIGAAMFFTDYSMAPSELGRLSRRVASNPYGHPNTLTFPHRVRRPFRKAVSSRRNITT